MAYLQKGNAMTMEQNRMLQEEQEATAEKKGGKQDGGHTGA